MNTEGTIFFIVRFYYYLCIFYYLFIYLFIYLFVYYFTGEYYRMTMIKICFTLKRITVFFGIAIVVLLARRSLHLNKTLRQLYREHFTPPSSHPLPSMLAFLPPVPAYISY